MRGSNTSPRFSPEQVFLSVGLLAGVIYALLTPPLKGADEPAHLYRAYQVSEGVVVAEKRGDGVGGLLPRSLKARWRQAAPNASHRGTQPVLERAWAKLIRLDPDDRIFVEFRNTALYAPVPYLPQALAIVAGRAFDLPPFVLLYLGRFAGLACSLGLIFLAIRVTPIAKRLFVLLAVTPMALRQMSLLTADSVTNASALLLIAMFLRLALDPEARLRGRFLVLLILCSLVVSLSKQAYFPLLFLYFACPIEKIGSRQRYLATFLCIAGLAAVALTVWSWAIRPLYLPQYIAPDADPVRQMKFIASHPITYTLTLLDDLRHNGASYLAQCFGYVGRPPQAFGWLHEAVLVLVALVDSGKSVALGLRAKLLILAVFASTLVLINTLNYLGWNAVGASSMSFIQGRYYIPITPLPLLLLSNRRFGSVLSERRLTCLVACFAVFVASVTIRFLVLRWYGV